MNNHNNDFFKKIIRSFIFRLASIKTYHLQNHQINLVEWDPVKSSIIQGEKWTDLLVHIFFELNCIYYHFKIWLSTPTHYCVILGLQRLPVQRFRKPLNRRIGNTVSSGFKGGRFNTKPIRKISKPQPNLAKFPGELLWLVYRELLGIF